MKKKKLSLAGLPVSFLDALGLALAAMILLMFTNLSALQSKTPPPERYHLVVMTCFSEVDISATFWTLKWLYQKKEILTSFIEKNFRDNKQTLKLTFAGEMTFNQEDLLSAPKDYTKKGDSVLNFYSVAEIREHENHSLLCHSLDLAFPIEEEPLLEIHIQRATKLPHNKKIDRAPNDGHCWRYAVLEKETSKTGTLFGQVYPFPQVIDVTAYTNGAEDEGNSITKAKAQGPKSKNHFQEKTWTLPHNGVPCGIQKLIYEIQINENKLSLKTKMETRR